MAQKRIHDYRGPRSSADLNRKFQDIIPPGVYSGFIVQTNGDIDPGVLMTEQGVRVEESGAVRATYGTSWEFEGVPANGGPGERYDLIVCEYFYEMSVPAPAAHYRVIQGTPGSGEYPDLPDHCVLLAKAVIPNGGSVWSEVFQAGPPEHLVNCQMETDGTFTILEGALAAFRTAYNVNDGKVRFYAIEPGSLSDGAAIAWGEPILSFDYEGIDQIQNLQTLLADTDATPGAGLIGVHAAAGSNDIVSIVSGPLQDAIEKIISDTDGAIQTNTDAIDDHVTDTEAAHAATAISNAAKAGVNGYVSIVKAPSRRRWKRSLPIPTT